jgi:2-hydroxychromene-2-carboxylate isomerase
VVVATVISLQHHRLRRAQHGPRAPRVDCFFALADPGTYLAAERVERLSAPVAWRPATLPARAPRSRARDERRAADLRLPLVWPESDGAFPRAMRVAAYASEQERGGVRFVLAASRLAFCGGFDLDDPLVLAEAIAAAGLDFDAAWEAAADTRRDGPMQAAGRFLASRGASELPVLQVGRALFHGEARVADAAAALRGARVASARRA